MYGKEIMLVEIFYGVKSKMNQSTKLLTKKINRVMKTILKFEKIMDKVSEPIAYVCCVCLVGRVLVSFVFGI
jgi:hypothetical protein